MKNRILYTGLLLMVAFSLKAQYKKGQFGVGGDFSFINSRNSLSRSTTDFNDNYSNGFNVSLIGGKFISSKNYLYGIVDVSYSSFVRNLITDNFDNKVQQEVFSSSFSLQAGVGLRRYFAVNEKNIVGLFMQGQLKVGNTWVTQRNFATQNDSVSQDVKINYPVRIFSASLSPGVYVNITPQWQLTANVGNLYFIQTIIPENEQVNLSKRNSSFGLDVNIFDFRLGVLYTPKKD